MKRALVLISLLACEKSDPSKATADTSSSTPSPSVSTLASAVAPTVAAPQPSVAVATASPSAVAKPGTVAQVVAPTTAIASAPSASAPSAPVAPGVGMHFDGSHFSVDVATPPPCAQNAECKVAVRLTAKDDFHVNKDYPYKLKLDDAPGATFLGTDPAGKSTFSKTAGDFSFDGEKAGVMTVRFNGSQPGAVALSGTLKLSVCNASNCQLEQAQVRATVPVK